MVEVLNLVFSSFWTFIGTLILLGVMVRGIVALAIVAITPRER